MAWPSSPGALRGRAERVVHGSAAVAAGPVAQDAAGVVFVRAPHRRDRYRSVSSRERRVRRMSCAGRLTTLPIRVSDPHALRRSAADILEAGADLIRAKGI